jgi:ribosomal protein S27AE
MNNICLICGKSYYVKPSHSSKRRTCGDPECKKSWISKTRKLTIPKGEQHYNWKGGKIKKICPYCGKSYFVKKHEQNKRVTCGDPDCQFKWKQQAVIGEKNPNWKGGNVEKICLICKGRYFVTHAREKTSKVCSKPDCISQWMSMIHHDITDPKDWEGYTSPASYCEKFTNEFKQRVYEFQNYECMEGGEITNTPHCHHLYEQKASCCYNLNEMKDFYFLIRGRKFYPSILLMPDNKDKELEYGLNKFIVLCGTHHGQARGKKNGMTIFDIIKKYENIINIKYHGRSYFERWEYWGNGYYCYDSETGREVYYDAITMEKYSKRLKGFQGWGLPKQKSVKKSVVSV